ncbi:MAG: TldD/PmbA family protein [Firmicutes bacterium]|nr:TldD/PmbA family protein [Bacillota bacterium]
MTLEMQDLARTVLRLAESSRQEVEVYTIKQRSLRVEVTDGEVETLREASQTGVGIRVIDRGRLGMAFTTRLDRESLKDAVQLAAANAQSSAADEFNRLPDPKPVEPMALLDPKLAELPVDVKIDFAKKVESAARGYDPRVTKVRQASYGDGVYEIGIANSRGVDVGYQGGYCATSLMVVAEADGQAETGWTYDFSRSFEGLDPVRVGREAAARAVEMLGAGSLATCRVPLILAPDVAAEFLEILGPALTAEAVQKGKSVFAGKLGEVVGSKELTLIDSGLLPQGIATAPVDDEGVPSQDTTVLEQGVLKTYLYNTYSAAKDGVESTGNGVRPSFRGALTSGTRNFYIPPGKLSQEELMGQVGRGLYVTSVMGMHTANPISGEFSVGAAGLWIENGRPARPVRGIAIAGNLIDLMKRLVAVGSDLRFYGSVGSPSLVVEGITVSGE